MVFFWIAIALAVISFAVTVVVAKGFDAELEQVRENYIKTRQDLYALESDVNALATDVFNLNAETADLVTAKTRTTKKKKKA